MKLFDAEPEFVESPDGLIIKKNQIITSDFLDANKEARSFAGREREFMHVAAVPTVVVEQWLREGFNIFQATGREIVERLKKQDLQAFLTTNKRV